MLRFNGYDLAFNDLVLSASEVAVNFLHLWIHSTFFLFHFFFSPYQHKGEYVFHLIYSFSNAL